MRPPRPPLPRSSARLPLHPIRQGGGPHRHALGATRSGAGDDRSTLVRLLADDDPTVRAAALDVVEPDDVVDDELVRLVVAAAEEARTQRSAAAALQRLGPSVVPLLSAALARNGGARRTPLVRAAAAAAGEHGLTVIEPALRDPDRVVVLAALSALDAAGGRAAVPAALLEEVFDDAAIHAARAVAARDALSWDGGPASDELRRALADELDLARQLVVAVLATRHGDGVREAVQVIERADGQRRALGVEALDVMLSRDEAEVALPLIRRDLAEDQGALRTRAQVPERPRPSGSPTWRTIRAGSGARPGSPVAPASCRPAARLGDGRRGRTRPSAVASSSARTGFAR